MLKYQFQVLGVNLSFWELIFDSQFWACKYKVFLIMTFPSVHFSEFKNLCGSPFHIPRLACFFLCSVAGG